MKKIAYLALYLLGLIISTVIQPSPAYAGYNKYSKSGCTPIYGGGVNCPQTQQLILDKKVKYPTTGSYVDNIGISDAKYSAGQTIMFQLTVENTGNVKVENVTITDTLPNYVEFVSGAGSYDGNNRTVTITVNTLNAGEKRTFEITTRAVSNENLPKDQVTCVVNSASVKGDNNTYDADSAQACIEKPVLGTTTVPVELPKSGPEYTITFAVGALGLIVVGRKLSRISL